MVNNESFMNILQDISTDDCMEIGFYELLDKVKGIAETVKEHTHKLKNEVDILIVMSINNIEKGNNIIVVT